MRLNSEKAFYLSISKAKKHLKTLNINIKYFMKTPIFEVQN